MKKTKFMRAALLLLVLTLITSCFVGGTFAKYTTDGRTNNVAHIAKFGVNVVAPKEGMFASTYTTNGEVKDSNGNVIADSVVAYGYQSGTATSGTPGYYTVAPGTSGGMTDAVTLTGTPEVAVSVKYVLNTQTTNSFIQWYLDDNYTKFYCPLIFTIFKGDVKVDEVKGIECKTAEELVNNLAAALDKCSDVYAPNTDLSTIKNGAKISWEWPFEGGTNNPGQTDENDKILGNRVTPFVVIDFNVVVTQID